MDKQIGPQGPEMDREANRRQRAKPQVELDLKGKAMQEAPVPRTDPMLDLVRQANNLQEFKNCHTQMMLLPTYPPQAMEILCAKTLNLAAKLNGHNDELTAQVGGLQARELSAVQEQMILKAIDKSTVQDLRSLLENKQPEPRNILEERAILRSLVSRLERQEQELIVLREETRSTTNMESEIHARDEKLRSIEIDLIRTEAERNTLVESLRIVVSKGTINPVEEGRQDGK